MIRGYVNKSPNKQRSWVQVKLDVNADFCLMLHDIFDWMQYLAKRAVFPQSINNLFNFHV